MSGHWDAIPRLPANLPVPHFDFSDRILAEVRQTVPEGLLRQRLRRREGGPGFGRIFPPPEAEQLRFDLRISAVGNAVAIQVAAGTAIPDRHLRRLTELQAGRLERYADLGGINNDRDENRVSQ